MSALGGGDSGLWTRPASGPAKRGGCSTIAVVHLESPCMTDPASGERLPAAVPLFPLPSVVLFPRAVLPLHIFEDRYRAMTADTLDGDGLIAMALLKSGWEKHYYGRPEIEPVVCVGRIISHEKLADGKYNFLLEGLLRARIVRELGIAMPYRIAELRRIEQVP